MRKDFLSIVFSLFLFSCQREAPPSPCEEVDCNNQGSCLHGSCICDEGFVGDDCETPIAPAELYIDQILIRDYPIYRDGMGWDSLLSGPYFLPDLQVELHFPGGDTWNSWYYSNAAGDPLIWTIETFPYLDNHINFGDSLELFVLELDGIDSLEVVAPPEVVAGFEFISSEFVLVDSTDWWPAQTSYISESSSVEVIVNWRYEWD